MQKKSKIRLFSLFVLLTAVIMWCSSQSETISAQDYNNELVALQESALQVVKEYYAELDQTYDGTNLSQIYADLQINLKTLADKAAVASGYKSDHTLKNAVLDYITGLQASLELNEKPTVLLLDGYTGSSQYFYEQDQQKITSWALLFAQDLARLDKDLDLAQAAFAKRHNILLP